MFEDTDSAEEEDAENKRKTMFRYDTTRLKLFEKELSQKPKGAYKVWMSELPVLSNLKTKIYLHAVHDSKIVYRISNR